MQYGTLKTIEQIHKINALRKYREELNKAEKERNRDKHNYWPVNMKDKP